MPISDVRLRTITREGENGPETVTFNPQVEAEVTALPDWAKANVVTDTTVRTIKCDNKNCTKEVSFSPESPEQVVALPDWVRTTRSVSLGNGNRFMYCSDVCEVEGVTTGDHNVPEPKQVQEATPADAQRAIAAAKVVEAMKTGPKGKGKGKVSLK